MVRLLLEGKRDKQIAFEMGITYNSVKAMMWLIQHKLGVHSRCGIVIWAFTHKRECLGGICA